MGSVQLTFERDSVCAGDDATAPNTVQIPYDHQPLISDVFAPEGPVCAYLPSVSAPRTYWAARIGNVHIANLCVSELAGRRLEVRLLASDRRLSSETMWFSYLGQSTVTPGN